MLLAYDRKTRHGGRHPRRPGTRRTAGVGTWREQTLGGIGATVNRRCHGSAVVTGRYLRANAVASLSLAERPSTPPCDADADADVEPSMRRRRRALVRCRCRALRAPQPPPFPAPPPPSQARCVVATANETKLKSNNPMHLSGLGWTQIGLGLGPVQMQIKIIFN